MIPSFDWFFFPIMLLRSNILHFFVSFYLPAERISKVETMLHSRLVLVRNSVPFTFRCDFFFTRVLSSFFLSFLSLSLRFANLPRKV